MRQQINLYLPEFQPARDWLNADRLVRAVVAVALVLMLISGYGYWRLDALGDEQARLQARLEAQGRETAELERVVDARRVDGPLQRELEMRQSRLERSRDLLGFLEADLRTGNTDGFSTMMKDLSRASFEGIWLTGIELTQGGESVTLGGVVQQSGMVPDFVGRLGNSESALRELRFDRLLGTRTGGPPGEPSPRTTGFEFVLEAQ